MTGGATRSTITPFADTRSQGYLFRTAAFKRGVMALQRAWSSNTFPVVLHGPAGLGKRTLVTAWLQNQQRGTITAARISAAGLSPEQLAEKILLAFGLKPTDRSSAEDALSDFLEDCVFDGRPGFVMVSDADEAAVPLWDELFRLAQPRAEGGVGLPVCMTTKTVPMGVTVVDLPRMGSGEAGRFIAGMLDAADVDGLTVDDVPVADLLKRAQGLAGKLGPELDAWYASHEDGAEPRVEEAAVEEPQETPAALAAASPTPTDIEAALMALSDESAPKPERVRESRSTKPSGERPARFPTIATGEKASAPQEPANDPVDAIAPKMATDLEAVAQDVAGLQGHLIVVRDQAEALRARLAERQRSRDEAVEAFAQSLQDLRA
ncbi:MAG: hypothetical protein HRU11_10220 [Parvularculaceae bacterium]|nr:hypothetical protein [Parvularculaceae bacterium]